jgi:hypothetical protein
MVESLQCKGYPFHLVLGITDMGIAGKEDLSLNAREGFAENGDGCRLPVFAYDGCKGLDLLLAYASIKVFSPGEIFGWVSPDVQGFLWVWGSRYSDIWGSR